MLLIYESWSYTSSPVCSDIYFHSSKAKCICLQMCVQCFYDCNKICWCWAQNACCSVSVWIWTSHHRSGRANHHLTSPYMIKPNENIEDCIVKEAICLTPTPPNAKITHTRTLTTISRHTLSALRVIVKGAKHSQTFKNNVTDFFSHPWHCFTQADENMQILTDCSIHNWQRKRPHPTASLT